MSSRRYSQPAILCWTACSFSSDSTHNIIIGLGKPKVKGLGIAQSPLHHLLHYLFYKWVTSCCTNPSNNTKNIPLCACYMDRQHRKIIQNLVKMNFCMYISI